MNESLQHTNVVCRTIAVRIETDRYGRRMANPIEPEPVPVTRKPVESFLAAIAPGKRIERLGRTSLALPNGDEMTPSCLFFQALQTCFADHYAFTIRPEVLMHLIVGEIATTVNRYPEAYRALFTRSSKKELVKVRHDGLLLGDPESPWDEAIEMFDPKLRELVPPGIMEHMLPEFSTATVESRVASLVAFMDAAQQFYDYRVETRCGIPEIRLAGEADDYKRVLTAAAQLSEPFRAHLGRYFDHLLPVLKTIADQAAGAPLDETFWKSIYSLDSGSGYDRFSGWATAFVNTIQTSPDPYQGKTTGEIVEKDAELYDWKNAGRGSGLDLGSVPSHVSSAPFIWDYHGREMKMRFMGGILGVDNFDDSLMPRLSYAILHDE